MLKSLTEIPSCISKLYILGCSSLERMTNQSILLKYNFICDHECGKLVLIQGKFKLEALENAGAQILGHFGLDVERMENVVFKMNHFTGADDKMLPLQGLYEHGVFSTFLPGNRIPRSFTSEKDHTNGLSFNIPVSGNNVRDLSIAVVFVCSEHQRCSRTYWCKQRSIVHNRTKDLKWIHDPSIFGMPEGTEEMTWLSHWKFGELLQDGDEISILVSLSRLKVKELRVQLVCDDQGPSDLSNCKVASPVPMFSNDNVR